MVFPDSPVFDGTLPTHVSHPWTLSGDRADFWAVVKATYDASVKYGWCAMEESKECFRLPFSMRNAGHCVCVIEGNNVSFRDPVHGDPALFTAAINLPREYDGTTLVLSDEKECFVSDAILEAIGEQTPSDIKRRCIGTDTVVPMMIRGKYALGTKINVANNQSVIALLSVDQDVLNGLVYKAYGIVTLFEGLCGASVFSQTWHLSIFFNFGLHTNVFYRCTPCNTQGCLYGHLCHFAHGTDDVRPWPLVRMGQRNYEVRHHLYAKNTTKRPFYRVKPDIPPRHRMTLRESEDSCRDRDTPSGRTWRTSNNRRRS